MMKRTKWTTMRLKRSCPPKSKTYVDGKGTLHIGLLNRYLRKAKKRGVMGLEFYDSENDIRTIFIFKQPLKRTR